MSVNWVSIGPGNGLSPVRCQAITWTNAGLLSIGPLGTNFSETRIKIQKFSFMKINFNLWSVKWPLFCPGGNELKSIHVGKKGPWSSLVGVMAYWLFTAKPLPEQMQTYYQTSNISCTSAGNEFVNQSDVDGASPVCCSNYIFILDLTPGFNGLGKDNCKTRWKTFKCSDLVRFILEVWWYCQLDT